MGSVRVRLSIMMFLEYAVWGVWAPTLSLHLAKLPAFRGEQLGDKIGWIYLAMPLANILSPFLAGQLADRYFSTEKFLAFSHLVGGALILWASYVTDYYGLFWIILGHCILYAPTVALTNSLAFAHLPNGEKDFGAVRLWGTIGWVAIGWIFGAWLDWATGADVGQCLLFAGVISLVMAAYCLTLPHTPPVKKVESPLAFLDALKLVRKPSFAVLLVIALLVSTELQFYYALTQNFFADPTDKGGLGLSQAWAIRVLTIGQIMEIVVLALLPLALKRLGFTWTITLGIAAWAVRYGMFALGEPIWAVIASQALHGFGFGFFFAGCMIYCDRIAPKDVRASAQSLFLLVTYGLGMLISSLIAGRVYDYFQHDWHKTFLVPVAILVVCALAFLIAFRPEPAVQETVPAGGLKPPPPPGLEGIPATEEQKYL